MSEASEKAIDKASETSLYDRLGGHDAIAKIAKDVFNNHLKNPKIKTRYVNSDEDMVVHVVSEFLWAATGGSEKYTGKNMVDAHTGMNINDEEFNAVLDDILKALDSNNVGEREKQELLMASYGLKGEVVGL